MTEVTTFIERGSPKWEDHSSPARSIGSNASLDDDAMAARLAAEQP
jgi:hypothetical protein